MYSRFPSHTGVSSFLLVAFVFAGLIGSAPAFANVISGYIEKHDQLTGPKGPSLSAKDLNGDPFQNPLDIGVPDNFNVEKVMPPAPAPPPQLNGSAKHQDQFDPQMDQGEPDLIPQTPDQDSAPQEQMFKTRSPEPDLKVEWDEWHKRVAMAIYRNYSFLAARYPLAPQPRLCSISYQVTRDGQIVHVELLQPSLNKTFNQICLAAVTALSSNQQLLAFPQGTHRMTVDKAATFQQNYGHEGLRYTINDHETVAGRF